MVAKFGLEYKIVFEEVPDSGAMAVATKMGATLGMALEIMVKEEECGSLAKIDYPGHYWVPFFLDLDRKNGKPQDKKFFYAILPSSNPTVIDGSWLRDRMWLMLDLIDESPEWKNIIERTVDWVAYRLAIAEHDSKGSSKGGDNLPLLMDLFIRNVAAFGTDCTIRGVVNPMLVSTPLHLMTDSDLYLLRDAVETAALEEKNGYVDHRSCYKEVCYIAPCNRRKLKKKVFTGPQAILEKVILELQQ